MRTRTLLFAVAVTTGSAGCGADGPSRTAVQARAVPTASLAVESPCGVVAEIEAGRR